MSQDARRDEEANTQRRAQVLNLPYANTAAIADKQLYRELIPVPELYSMRVVPLQVTKGNIHFGITTTTSQQAIVHLRQRFADSVTHFSIISDVGYRDYMRLYDPPKQVIYEDIKVGQGQASSQLDQISNILQQVKADDMLAYLVAQAHNLGASDIHIECQAENVRIRFRIDGVLHPIALLQFEKYRVLLSAIASAGNISTSADEAQQGHIGQKVTMADGTLVDVNVRLESVPTVNGIDVVMRLFNMDASKYTLDRLGLSSSERGVIDEIISKPTGLLMVVGPTGSGKTTTLYSILNTLNNDERKIITVEDPVEYQFPGIVQIPVKATESGNDNKFADKLRAILRLDPDIVMVGEIRDNDTAHTALQAALTGHLVCATFHASSAAAALTRLQDVIGQNPLFVSAIRLVMAQRLVRRLDDSLKQPVDPTEAEWNKIVEVINSLPHGVERPNLDGLKLYKPGTSPENPFGFKGQIAVREQFRMTHELRQLLERPSHILSSQDIEEAAVNSGMTTMLQDAMLKVVAGETTLDEIFRVVG